MDLINALLGSLRAAITVDRNTSLVPYVIIVQWVIGVLLLLLCGRFSGAQETALFALALLFLAAGLLTFVFVIIFTPALLRSEHHQRFEQVVSLLEDSEMAATDRTGLVGKVIDSMGRDVSERPTTKPGRRGGYRGKDAE